MMDVLKSKRIWLGLFLFTVSVLLYQSGEEWGMMGARRNLLYTADILSTTPHNSITKGSTTPHINTPKSNTTPHNSITKGSTTPHINTTKSNTTPHNSIIKGSTTIEDTMRGRVTYMRQKCHDLHLTMVGTLMPPVSLVPELKEKRIFDVCMVNKGASTSWYILGEQTQYLMANKYKDRLPEILLVRHPLARLISAYRDKYLNGLPLSAYTNSYRRKNNCIEPWHTRWYAYWLPALISSRQVSSIPLHSAIAETTRINSGPHFTLMRLLILKAYESKEAQLMNQFRNTTSFTFEEFLRHLVWTYELGLQDRHWASIFLRCEPCTHRYDYVVVLENVDEEVNYLLQLVGYPTSTTFPHKHTTRFNKSIDLSLYSGIPTQLLERILQLYHLDFQLFDYSKDL